MNNLMMKTKLYHLSKLNIVKNIRYLTLQNISNDISKKL